MGITDDKKKVIFFSRLSLFIVYFWFGLLKVLNLSPAEPLVHELFQKTLSFLPYAIFFPLFGLFECIIGVMCLLKGHEKVLYYLVLLHLFTTALPLILLPSQTWTGFMVPTMAGQYILKNFLIYSAVFTLLKAKNLN